MKKFLILLVFLLISCPSVKPTIDVGNCPTLDCEVTFTDARVCEEVDCGVCQVDQACTSALDVIEQNGCPLRACDVSTDRVVTGCRSIGFHPHYDSCETSRDCQAGDTCFQYNGSWGRECLPHCNANDILSTPCPEEGKCLTILTGPPGLGVCTMWLGPCDPITGAGCPVGQQCFLKEETTFCEVPTSQAAGEGEPCDHKKLNGCQIGLSCITLGTKGPICVSHCYLTDPFCPGVKECEFYIHPIYGVCL